MLKFILVFKLFIFITGCNNIGPGLLSEIKSKENRKLEVSYNKSNYQVKVKDNFNVDKLVNLRSSAKAKTLSFDNDQPIVESTKITERDPIQIQAHDTSIDANQNNKNAEEIEEIYAYSEIKEIELEVKDLKELSKTNENSESLSNKAKNIYDKIYKNVFKIHKEAYCFSEYEQKGYLDRGELSFKDSYVSYEIYKKTCYDYYSLLSRLNTLAEKLDFEFDYVFEKRFRYRSSSGRNSITLKDYLYYKIKNII